MQLHAAFETLRHSPQVAFPVALEGQLLGAVPASAPLGDFLKLAKENPRVVATVKDKKLL